MPVTIYDIAQKVNLSHSAVSMALRGSSRVSAATRRKVRALADEMGYQPNFFARGLKSVDTRLIAAIMPLDSNPTGELVQAIQKLCLVNGYHVVWQNLPPDIAGQRRVFNLLTQGIFDGALVEMHTYEAVEDLVRKFIDSGRPMVVIGPPHDLPVDSGVLSTRIDGSKAVRSATRQLIDRGHRRIAHIVHDPMTPSEVDSHRVIRNTLKSAGITDWTPAYRFRFSPDGNNLRDGYRCAAEIIDAGSSITAVECPNDLFGIGFMTGVYDAGLEVPGDISILGSNNMPHAECCRVPLSTVDIKYSEAAAKGCELLQRKLREKDDCPDDGVTIHCDVVMRDSIGPVRKYEKLPAKKKRFSRCLQESVSREDEKWP